MYVVWRCGLIIILLNCEAGKAGTTCHWSEIPVYCMCSIMAGAAPCIRLIACCRQNRTSVLCIVESVIQYICIHYTVSVLASTSSPVAKTVLCCWSTHQLAALTNGTESCIHVYIITYKLLQWLTHLQIRLNLCSLWPTGVHNENGKSIG